MGGRGWLVAMLGSLCLGAPAAAIAEDPPQPLVVASGEAEGVFLPEAAALCRIVNKDHATPRCLVLPSGGSVANLAALSAGTAQLAVVQSALAADAASGEGRFKEKRIETLRALFSLHAESVVALAGPDTDIKTLADLKGKRVNLGRPGGFQRVMAEALLGGEKIAAAGFSARLDQDPAASVKALCESQIDATFISGIHPMTEIEEAIDCGARVIAPKGAVAEAAAKAVPGFTRLKIARGTYPGLDETLASIGPRALVVATSALSDDEAYAITRAAFENLAPLKAMHPLLAGLDRKIMADLLSVPVHDGAKRYFRENKLP